MGSRPIRVAAAFAGAAALGYQSAWARLIGLSLGHDLLGVYAAIAATFGGWALGAVWGYRRVRVDQRPARTYAFAEGAAAFFALTSPYFLHALTGPLAGLLGASTSPAMSALAVLLATAVLLPGTFALGGAFVLLVETARRQDPEHAGADVARLYALHTLGAALGILLTLRVALPRLGFPLTMLVLALAGALAATVVWRHAGTQRAPRNEVPSPALSCADDPDPGMAAERWLIHLLLFGTGLTGLGLEVLGVRIASQVLPGTVFAYADALTIYLLGNFGGALLYAFARTRWVEGRPATVAWALLVLSGASIGLAAFALRASPHLLAALAPDNATTATASMVAQLSVAASVFAIPTLVSGALFAHLLACLSDVGVGRGVALNALGAAIAPFVFGFVGIARFGTTDTFFALAWIALGLALVFGYMRRMSSVRQAVSIGIVLASTSVGVLGPGPASDDTDAPALLLARAAEGWKVVARHEGPLGVVTVSERGASVGTMRRLQVDAHYRMGGALSVGERRMGHIPVLLAPDAKRALFLGVGTGATAGAALHSRQLEQLDGVELVPEVLEVLPHFVDVNGGLAEDPRVSLHAADARRFVAASERQWDLIVADLFHPGRDGAGRLYSAEHFESVHASLDPHGVFVQWIPLHQLDEASLRTIVGTFTDTFSDTHAILGLYNAATPPLALVGRRRDAEPLRLDLERLVAGLREPSRMNVALADARDFMAAHLLDDVALRALAGEAPRERDLNPRVVFDVPSAAVGPRAGLDNLEMLFAIRVPYPEEMVVGVRAGALREAVAPFAQALGLYLEGERILHEARLADPAAPVPAGAVDAWLRSFETTPEFVPPRGRLFAAAHELEHAEHVLGRMMELAPSDPRVRQEMRAYLSRIGDADRLRILDGRH